MHHCLPERCITVVHRLPARCIIANLQDASLLTCKMHYSSSPFTCKMHHRLPARCIIASCCNCITTGMKLDAVYIGSMTLEKKPLYICTETRFYFDFVCFYSHAICMQKCIDSILSSPVTDICLTMVKLKIRTI